MIEIQHTSIETALALRQLGNQGAAGFMERALRPFGTRAPGTDRPATPGTWLLRIHSDAIFDRAGIQAVTRRIERYRGSASELRLELELPPEAWRDYYSLQCDAPGERATIELPMSVSRLEGDGSSAVLIIKLRWIETPLRFPGALAPATVNATPTALLMRYSCDHDVLFANQVLVFSELAGEISRSPWTWIKAACSRLPGKWAERIPPSFRKVHPSARVHPTAVIEGSAIGKGSRVGAHCVVRYSRIGEGVQLHDGAKVEYSVVDDNSWLMHDLVLYRCHVEPDVFLIHGPYQFSCFQRGSAAFATIMMDYRPDGRPIKVQTEGGVRAYAGRFIGALMEEGSKVVGGSLLAPGITVPRERTVGPPADQLIRPKTLGEFVMNPPFVPARGGIVQREVADSESSAGRR